MRRLLPLVPLLALAGACHRGPVHDASQFHGARLLDDGKTGLVSFTRGRYRLVDPDPIFGGGVPSFIEDVKLLARIDVATCAVDVILRDEHPRGGNGTGNWTISDTCGRVALVHRGRRTSYSGPEIPGTYALIDVDTGALRELDPNRELVPWRAELRHGPRLLDERGVLLYEAYPTGEESPDANQSVELFLRQPNGSIEELGHGQYQLHGDGELYLWFPGDRECTEIELFTGAKRHVTNREYADASAALRDRVTRALHVSSDKQSVELATKTGGTWTRVPAPIDREALR